MNRNRRLRVGELQQAPQNAEIAHPKRKADAPLATESLAENHSPQNDILHLQKTLGNAAVRRRLQNGTLNTAKSPGQRLPGNISGTMQTLFGNSAPDTQVHTGAEADVIARAPTVTRPRWTIRLFPSGQLSTWLRKRQHPDRS